MSNHDPAALAAAEKKALAVHNSRKVGSELYENLDREQCADLDFCEGFEKGAAWREANPPPVPACEQCKTGFPLNGRGYHYGTQALGMIPNTKCTAVPEDVKELRERLTEEYRLSRPYPHRNAASTLWDYRAGFDACEQHVARPLRELNENLSAAIVEHHNARHALQTEVDEAKRILDAAKEHNRIVNAKNIELRIQLERLKGKE